MRGYTWFITRTLRWRYTTLLAAIGSLVVAVYFMAQVPGSFLPPEDVSRVSISVELPPGSTLADTDATTGAMHAIIKNVEGVESVFILGGTSPKGELDIRRASVSVNLEKIEHSIVKKVVNGLAGAVPFVSDSLPRMEVLGRVRTQGEIEAEIFDKLTTIPDIRAYKLNDRGERDLSYNVISTDDAAIDPRRGDPRAEAQGRGSPVERQCLRFAAASRSPDPSAAGRGCATWRDHGADCRDGTCRHHRRHRRGTGQDFARQPPDPDPGAARSGVPNRYRPDRQPAHPHRARRHGTAQDCRRRLHHPGPLHHQPLQPRAAGDDRRQPADRRGARYRQAAVQRDRQLDRVAGRRAGAGIGRRGSPERVDGQLPQRHADGAVAGPHSVDPAVQGRDPAVHDPVLAAARHWRRGGGPDPDQQLAVDAGADWHPDADGDRH